MPWKRTARWTIGFVMFVGWLACLCLLFGFPLGCHSTQPAITAAEVVNEVAQRGDQAFQVSVSACHAAEQVAAELPDVDKASSTVLRIRAACDHVFARFDLLRTAITKLDEAMGQAADGRVSVRDLVTRALDARALLDSVKAEDASLAQQLREGTL